MTLAADLRHWHARSISAAGLLGLLAAAVTVGVVGVTAMHGVVNPGAAVAFLAVAAAGETLRVRLPGDRDAAPIGVAASLGYALLTTMSHSPAQVPVAQVLAVAAVGSTAGTLLHAIAGRQVGLSDIARRLAVVGVASAVFRPLDQLVTKPGTPLVLAMLAAALGAAVVDAILAAALRRERAGMPFRTALADEIRALGGLGAAMGATGILIALAATELGLISLPVFCVPLLVTQFSFRRYAAIRSTSRETIRALSRITEVGGYVETGHSERVAELAVRMGRDLGLEERALLDVEYAALMHDIGQLSFPDPVPGGSTLVVAPGTRRQIAELGAEVIRRAGTLNAVADIVERQADPYRAPGQGRDGSLPIGARIVRIANAYDDLVGGTTGQAVRREDALEHLRLGMAYEYDPRVVDSLQRVLQRYGEPGA